MKKRILFLSMLLLIVLNGCGYTLEEKALMKEYKRQGKLNSIDYIEYKYGFTPTVLAVNCNKINTGPVPDLSPAPSGAVTSTMLYNDKTFQVFISGDSESLDGSDNYQYEEIKYCLQQVLEDKTGIEINELFLNCGSSNSEKNTKVKKYFDGVNFKSVLNDTANVAISCVNQSLDNMDWKTIINNLGISDILIVNYDSLEHYNYVQHNNNADYWYPSNNYLNANSIYIKEYYLIGYENKHIKFTQYEFDGIKFAVEGESYFNVNISDSLDASNWNGKGFTNAKSVLDTYSVSTDAKSFNIFIPIEKLNSVEDPTDNVSIVSSYVTNGKETYNYEITDLTNNECYLHCKLNKDYTDFVFTVLHDE